MFFFVTSRSCSGKLALATVSEQLSRPMDATRRWPSLRASVDLPMRKSAPKNVLSSTVQKLTLAGAPAELTVKLAR